MNEEVKHLTDRRAELEELELVAMLDQDPIDAELAALAERTHPLEERAAELRGQVEPEQAEIDAAIWPRPSRPGPPRRPSCPPRWPTATRRCGPR